VQPPYPAKKVRDAFAEFMAVPAARQAYLKQIAAITDPEKRAAVIRDELDLVQAELRTLRAGAALALHAKTKKTNPRGNWSEVGRRMPNRDGRPMSREWARSIATGEHTYRRKGG
jgi:hypothetical protein